jgi:hypothetical protein
MAAHDEAHPLDVDGCRTCKYRTIRLSNTCTPSKSPSLAAPKRERPSWESGIATDHRGVPYLDQGRTIGVKQFAENRSKYEEAIRRNKTAAPVST